MPANANDWIAFNQRHLTAALAEVRARLERQASGGPACTPETDAKPVAGSVENCTESGEPLPALEIVTRTFGLTVFERALLLLCAGIELDSSLACLCASAQGVSTRTYPTFSLALASLPAPHWSALNPGAPLRRWRLIEIVNQLGVPLTVSPLRVDERILHFLTGLQYLDERLVGLLTPMTVPDNLVPSHAALARSIVTTWNSQRGQGAIQLCGSDEITKRSIATTACAEAGLPLYALAGDHIPSNALELEGLTRLWERESVLTSSVLYIDTASIEGSDFKGLAQVSRLLDHIHGPVILSTNELWRPCRRSLKTLLVGKPTASEQQRAWQELLDAADIHINGQLPKLVAQFNLTVPAIHASVLEALESDTRGEAFVSALWEAGRSQARTRIGDLAQWIEPVARWDDLVLPANEKTLLRDIASHVKHRSTVYETWGFSSLSSRGLGISALFAGTSGTGKTMASEVLANELQLDLYRIDLSSVVSKYIGETEKNLRRVFDAAEDGGAILFFDEADALFGKRSEVKDSHDRYANIEINYLLQRMECYRGLAVLATNMRKAMDPAFLRRIRFVVNFPFPEFEQRAEIWERIFPRKTPLGRLNVETLAQLAIAGGNIRNIAINAAFRAAEEGTPVGMMHLAQAARNEFMKMEKPVPEAEIAGWA